MTYLEVLANPFVVGVSTAVATGLLGWGALKHQLTRLEQDVDKLRATNHGQEEQIKELEKTLHAAGSEASDAKACRSEIVRALNTLLEHSGAGRASFYAPVHNMQNEFLGLIVMATAPHDLSAGAFIGTVFSGRDSKAVECYLKGEAIESQATAFSLDNFVPKSTYAECLQLSAMTGGGEKVGVVQLLSEAGQPFSKERAREAIRRHGPRLSELGSTFVGENERKIDLTDLKVPRESRRGTVLSMDISNSSGLFINEARSFETRKFMSELIGLSVHEINRNTGVFESFTGDGFMAAFSGGARRPGNNPSQRALASALAIGSEFDALIAKYRADFEDLPKRLSLRFGLATGAIHPVTLSFGQLRISSIIGRTPSLAKRVCDMGARDQTSVTIDFATFWELPSELQARFGRIEQLDKRKETDQVYRFASARPRDEDAVT